MNIKALFASVFLLSASPAIAEPDNFYYSDVQGTPFFVYGALGDSSKNLNPSCYAAQSYKDGSEFRLIRDLKDGELWMIIQNVNWDMVDKPESVFNMQINFYRGNDVKPMTFDYVVLNKNTIAIRNIIKDGSFLPAFMIADRMMLIMPGSIPNAYIPLNGSRKAIEQVAECIRSARDKNLWVDDKPTVKELGI